VQSKAYKHLNLPFGYLQGKPGLVFTLAAFSTHPRCGGGLL